MSQRRRIRLGSEEGATLVLVALSLVVLLGMGALAVDMAAAFSWRVEARKIADSSALAGASAFLDYAPAEVTPPAEARAYEYALRHTIKGVQVDSSEVQVVVIPDSQRVRVRVGRDGMPTWFARVLGINDVDIAAVSAAEAVAAGAARCLKPIALPDLWRDADDDLNNDGMWDPNEDWAWEPDQGDTYTPLSPDAPISSQTDATSYGSDARNASTGIDRDYGRAVQIKAQDPQDPYNYAPGIFYPWRIPEDPDMESCGPGGGGGGGNDAGGAIYRANICSCNNAVVELGVPYDIEPGNMVGPTVQGVGDLYDRDPQVFWGDATDGSGFTGPVRTVQDADGNFVNVPAMDSPRVMKIALFAPDVLDGSGMQEIIFNNFALMFLEEKQQNQRDPVVAKFLQYVSGDQSESNVEGALVRYLRLVE
jgi:hypothetical protein